MEYELVAILRRDGRFALDEWIAFIDASPQLRREVPEMRPHPFTKEPRVVWPSPEEAGWEEDGRRVVWFDTPAFKEDPAVCAWAVRGDEKALSVIKRVAEEFGCTVEWVERVWPKHWGRDPRETR